VQIDISQILGRKGISMPFKLCINPKDILGYPSVMEFLKPVNVEGIVTNTDGIYLLEGKGETEVSIPCDRCLSPVNIDVLFNFNEKFKNAGVSDEEIQTFSGDIIDLTDIIRKSILLCIPMKILCSDDCKGLCPVCGKDLNKGVCGCDTTYINPKFESLRSLFKVDEEV